MEGFSVTEAYSADGLSDGGLSMLGRAIQEEFHKRNNIGTESYTAMSEPVSPFAFSSSSLENDFGGEEEPD